MKSKIAVGVIFVCLFATAVFGTPMTEIWYETSYLGPGLESGERWEYTYDVYNLDLAVGIEEFTVWFDFGLYDNLVVTTPETPPEWDQIVWQVEPVLEDPGGYDTVATNLNIAEGISLSGFSVSFDWLGAGEPGSQYYEIINPVTFATIEDGYTVPEPVTLLLLGFGGLVLLGRRRACN